MELTYNQIIKVLNDFATNHYQINEFGNGDLWEVMGWLEEFDDNGLDEAEQDEFENKEGLIKLFTLTSISIIAIVGSLGLKNYWKTDIDEPSLKLCCLTNIRLIPKASNKTIHRI